MQKIRHKLAASFLALIFLSLFIGSLLTLQAMQDTQNQTLAQGLGGEARWLAQQIDQLPDTADVLSRAQALAAGAAAPLGRDVYLLNASGQPVSGTNSDAARQFALPPGPGPGLRSVQDSQSLTLICTLQHTRGPIAAVAVAAPLSSQSTDLLLRWGWFTATVAALGLVVAGLGYWLAVRLATPLERITQTTQKISQGEFRVRIPYWGQDEYGRLSAAINTLTNALVQQMDDLSEEESKIQGIIAHMGSGVLVVDRSGRIEMANHATAALFGVPSERLVGKSHWEATPSPQFSDVIDTVLVRGEPVRRELSLQQAGDVEIDLYATPIRARNDEIVGVVAVLHDVTKWRRVERLRTEFVANVSHELRTPITAVKGFAETLLDGALEDAELSRQFVQIIYKEADRLSRLISDLLELSKIESGHSVMRFEPMDLSALVKDTVAPLRSQAEQNGLTLRTSVPTAPVVADVAPDRVAQVLINLVGNAIAYTPAPGDIEVTVRDAGDAIDIAVRDTGIGIPDSDLPRIFERFYRVDKDRSRRTGGTGLGLAIVKHIIEAHKGRISVTSAVGKGTTFVCSFPKRQTPEPELPSFAPDA